MSSSVGAVLKRQIFGEANDVLIARKQDTVSLADRCNARTVHFSQ